MKTVLGIDVQTKKAIMVNDKTRSSGMYILGAQGLGKSLLLANLIYQDAQKGYAIIVIDPHGDLINHVISILPEERLKQTYLLDLTDTAYPFSLNLFSCSDPTDEVERTITLERVMHVFEQIWSEMRGVLLEKLLRFVTLTLLERPGSTLLDIRRLLWDDAYRANIVGSLTNEEVRAYWEKEYNTMTLGERRKEIQALDNRLAALRSTPIVKNIVGQRKNTIDFKRAILNREILLVHLPERIKNAADLIGTILLTQIHSATFAFGELPWNERPGFSLFVDEFQNYTTTDFAILLKEGRKYGARITVAHQDRHDLLPANRSATLTASIIVSLRPTPEDAAELAPLYFDASATIRPERIYRDVVGRLRMHEHQLIQDFFQRYVKPLQQEKRNQRRRQDVLETLQDLLYQSVKTESIHESLLDACLQGMYPLLDLTFDAPQNGLEHLQGQLHQREHNIAKLQSFLSNEGAFREYLALYHSYYPVPSLDHLRHRRGQSPIAEDELLADTTYWNYVLGNGSRDSSRRPQDVLSYLERLAGTNNALRNRNTRVRIIAQERMRVMRRWKQLFKRIWERITALHKLEGKYASNPVVGAFHTSMYHTYLVMPLEQKPEPIFFYPVRCRKAGIISDRAHIKDLIIEPLPFELANAGIVTSWIPSDGYVNPLGPNDPEALHAYAVVEKAWQDIVHAYREMQRIASALTDTAALLKVYYLTSAPTVAERQALSALTAENLNRSLWEMLRQEARRNARLGNHMNTVDKLIRIRKSELRKKIALLIEERKAYEEALFPLEREIEQEIAAIEEQRSALRDYLRRVLQLLIADPGPLGEKKTPKESDVKAQLLNLGKRQALVRVGENSDQKPRVFTMKTADVPQALKRDEADCRHQQIRDQTRTEYCQEQGKVEQKVQDEDPDIPKRDDEFPGEEPPDPWYEE